MIAKSSGKKSESFVQDCGCVRALKQISRSVEQHQFRAFYIHFHDVDARNIVILHKNIHRSDANVFLADHSTRGMARLTQGVLDGLSRGH